MNPMVIDRYISAELPRPQNNPTRQLTNIIQTIIVYRPCSANNLNTPYIVAGSLGYLLTYLKQFPKPFCPVTAVHNNSYPQYHHHNNLQLWPVCILGGNSTTINLNNHQIILYNPYFSVKYRAHINIEVYASIQAVKYIYKYIYKRTN